MSQSISSQPQSDTYQKMFYISTVTAVTFMVVTIALVTIFALTNIPCYLPIAYSTGACTGLSLIPLAIGYMNYEPQTSEESPPSFQSPQNQSLQNIALSRVQRQTQILEGHLIRETITFPQNTFNQRRYVNWVNRRGGERSRQKQALLDRTLLLPPSAPIGPFRYEYLSINKGRFLEKLNDPLEQARVNYHTGWYDYREEGHTYIDFANECPFGGGVYENGNAQEELMFCEFPQLSRLDYVSHRHYHYNNIQPVLRCNPNRPEPVPFTVNVQREFEILNPQHIYGQNLHNNILENQVASHVRSIPNQNRPTVRITGIDAKRWRAIDRGSHYEREDLLYHLQAAYLAFMGEKINNPSDPRVHTGLWGCGACINSPRMMLAIQYLAARLAGVNINFWGLSPARQRDLGAIIHHINTLGTANQVLDFLNAQQNRNNGEFLSWCPARPQSDYELNEEEGN